MQVLRSSTIVKKSYLIVKKASGDDLLETVAKPQANAPAKPGSDAPDGLQTVTN